ncbi:LexA family protein [Pseudomonas sp. W5-01]|uniref:LexA family protein n=1 Tax=Pseudomonas sp. W5-01 TaxID=3097454 RepID=UPI00397BF8D9
MIDDHVKISLDEQLNIRAAGTYLVKVDGDSMQGVGIYSGDILIVDKAIDPRAGHVVIAVVNREPMVKLLSFEVSGTPILRSANPRYPSCYIMENDEFEVWGVVTHSLRDHARN